VGFKRGSRETGFADATAILLAGAIRGPLFAPTFFKSDAAAAGNYKQIKLLLVITFSGLI